MPYTPPATQSPVASRPGTPSLSRSHLHSKAQQQNGSASTRANPPHTSSSYLHRHRRSPSISKPTPPASESSTLSDANEQPERSEDGPELNKSSPNGKPNQHPPTRPIITTGAVIPGPESSQSSSDDEHNSKRGRVRELENLSELQAAIRIIEQHRQSSPDWRSEETKQARMTLGLDLGRSEHVTKDLYVKTDMSPRLPLSAEARKISHSRSSTAASPLVDFTRQISDSPARSDSDCEDLADDELKLRPTMVRKKSGELVRPALRPASAKRRPSSMPGTPTYSKAVHFDSRLEHVRHFLQVDRPLAVSAGSSPVDTTLEDDLEFPFGEDARSKSPPFEWEIRLTNSPAETAERKSLPVRVERVFLSSDNKNLVGAVVAKNIAFHKQVVARFTLDYWKTTSEVIADYDNDIRRKQINDDCDRFHFSIKLEDQTNLENKTMFFCVRYNVNGQEFWDNNSSFNFQVDFSKKAKPTNSKNGIQENVAKPLNGLPRSKPSPRPHGVSRAPSDDFAASSLPYEFSSFPQPATLIGDTPIRFRSIKSAGDILPDGPGSRGHAAGQGFSNRYDFGASISAAKQMAGTATGEVQKQHSFASTRFAPQSAKAFAQTNGEANRSPETEKMSGVPDRTEPTAKEHSKPAALTAEKPSLQSSSYHELLDKYCFVRSRIENDGKGSIC